MARPKKIKEEIEVKPEIVIVSDELEVISSDSEEQVRLKGVFAGFRKANPELWKRDKEIYLNQIKNNGGK